MYYKCIKSVRMNTAQKEIAFKKGNVYPCIGAWNGAIDLLNEQGEDHTIHGDFLKRFLKMEEE